MAHRTWGRGVALAVPLVIAGSLFVLADGDHAQDRGEGSSYLGVSRAVAPIPGALTTLAEAEGLVDFPIPVLPQTILPDPCSGVKTAISIQQVWASTDDVPKDSMQVGVTYTHGLWMSINSLGLYTFADAAEIPPVEEVFDPADFPQGLYDTQVRGHPAWAKDFDPDFKCAQQNPGGHAHVTTTPDPPTNEATALLYDPRVTGSIRWMENGAVIHLVGPFTVGQLIELADGLSWS
jgi:hypothetical protein